MYKPVNGEQKGGYSLVHIVVGFFSILLLTQKPGIYLFLSLNEYCFHIRLVCKC